MDPTTILALASAANVLMIAAIAWLVMREVVR
jgi:hypothetical protein